MRRAFAAKRFQAEAFSRLFRADQRTDTECIILGCPDEERKRPKADFDAAAVCRVAAALAQQKGHQVEQPDCTYLSSQIAIHNTEMV